MTVRLLSLLLACLALPVMAEPLRVLSFNVRYPNPQDGPDVWEQRRELLVDTIRRTRPDVIGTQELFKLQGDYIVASLPEYAWFGVSRRGNSEDEHMGVFYRRDQLRLIESGNFWLSETPEVAGSQSWDMTLPRMVTWGLFERQGAGAGQRFYFFNTHFAHRRQDEEARRKSVAVIAARLGQLKKGVPVVLTGDFNAGAGGAVHEEMLRRTGLRDTRAIAQTKEGPEGTFHGFKGEAGANRIDWILVSDGWKVKRNAALTIQQNGRYPSDHFPVLAELE